MTTINKSSTKLFKLLHHYDELVRASVYKNQETNEEYIAIYFSDLTEEIKEIMPISFDGFEVQIKFSSKIKAFSMLKEKINQEFVSAFKAKNLSRKDTLGLLKAKITEAEKKKNNEELTDEEVYSVITSMIKQREQSITAYNQNNSEQAKINAQKEADEIIVLKEFLPEQMSDLEMTNLVASIANENLVSSKPLLGIVMKEFNSNYKGKFDNNKLRAIVETFNNKFK